MRKSTHEAAANDALHANLRTLRRAGVVAEPATTGSYIIAFPRDGAPLQLGTSRAVRRFVASVTRGGK